MVRSTVGGEGRREKGQQACEVTTIPARQWYWHLCVTKNLKIRFQNYSVSRQNQKNWFPNIWGFPTAKHHQEIQWQILCLEVPKKHNKHRGILQKRKIRCSRSESAAERLSRVTPIPFRWDGTGWNRQSCTYISVKSCWFPRGHC